MKPFDESDLEIDVYFKGIPKKSTKMICRKDTSVCSRCLYVNNINECPIDIEVFNTIDKDTFYCSNYKDYK